MSRENCLNFCSRLGLRSVPRYNTWHTKYTVKDTIFCNIRFLTNDGERNTKTMRLSHGILQRSGKDRTIQVGEHS